MKINFKPKATIRDLHARDYILKEWCRILSKNSKLFPGNLVRVDNHKVKDGKMVIDTDHITYDDYLVTRTKKFRKKFPKELSANPLSVGAIVVTNDDHIIIGPRKEQTSQKGQFTLPSGMIDSEDVHGGKVDVFGAIIREILEETGIKNSKLTNLVCYRFILNKKYDQSYLAFYAKVNWSSKEIELLPRRDDEIEIKQENFCKNEKKEISSYIKKYKNRLSDIAEPSLFYYKEIFDKVNHS